MLKLLGSIGLSLLITACAAETPNGNDSSGKTAELTKITFVTDWKAQAEHGGYYQGLAKGIFKAHGIDLRIMQGGPDVNVPQLLAGGAADFGMGSNGFIPLNIVKAEAPLRAVMAVFQKDPQVLMTHPRDDIKSLADMKGKPIMISDASITAFWPWLKSKYGFADTQIRKYTFNLAPFLVDKTAIQEGYLSSEPFTAEKEGKFKPQVFLLADNGYPGYANMILVSQKRIEEKPAIVQEFVNASIESWADYLFGDPAPGNELIKKDNPEMKDDLISQAIEKMKSYGIVVSGDAVTLGIGSMTDERWKTFFDTMSSEGLYPATLDYKKAYDLRFVNKKVALDRIR
jgi:NitT/TauT family transport system substrate-binding protein